MKRYTPTAAEFDLYAPTWKKCLYDVLIGLVGFDLIFAMLLVLALLG